MIEIKSAELLKEYISNREPYYTQSAILRAVTASGENFYCNKQGVWLPVENIEEVTDSIMNLNRHPNLIYNNALEVADTAARSLGAKFIIRGFIPRGVYGGSLRDATMELFNINESEIENLPNDFQTPELLHLYEPSYRFLVNA